MSASTRQRSLDRQQQQQQQIQSLMQTQPQQPQQSQQSQPQQHHVFKHENKPIHSTEGDFDWDWYPHGDTSISSASSSTPPASSSSSSSHHSSNNSSKYYSDILTPPHDHTASFLNQQQLAQSLALFFDNGDELPCKEIISTSIDDQSNNENQVYGFAL
jgi:hypothetical protein